MEFKFSEKFIQNALDGFFSISSVQYSMENLFVFDWESDKLLKTRSGNYHEFEIKISKSDFKNDFKNKKDKHLLFENTLKEKEKNPESGKSPNYFYYAVPESLILKEDVPEYAGLVYVNEYGGLTLIKDAPRLHKVKYTDDDLGLAVKFYYNMESWKEKAQQTLEYKRMLDEEKKSHGREMTYEKMEKTLKIYKDLNEQIINENLKLKKDVSDSLSFERKLIRKIKEYEPDFDEFAI